MPRIKKTRKQDDKKKGGGGDEKKPGGVARQTADILPPTPNTIAGPTESTKTCGDFEVVFRSAFAAGKDFAITIVNLADCPIGTQIYSGVGADGSPTRVDPGSAQVRKNGSTSLAGTVPSGGGFMVLCTGEATGGQCKFLWRIDRA